MVNSSLRDEPINVLLVDDNFDDYVLSREYVEMFNFPIRLEYAESLRGAASISVFNHIDVVLLDLNLIETKGLVTFEEAKRAFPKSAIILLTGDAHSVQAVESLRLGAQDFLVKGHFDETDLEKAIRFSHERHKQTSKLAEKTTVLDCVFEMQSVGLLVLDSRFTVTRCNKRASEMLGVRVSDILGWVSPIDPTTDFPREMIGPQSEVFELNCERGLLDGAGGEMSIITILDISERKRSELEFSENEKSKITARVCYGVAHEFNNLLAMTRTKTDFLDTLSRGDPVWSAHVEDLKKGCDRGAELVERLMTFYEKKSSLENSLELAGFFKSHESLFDSICAERYELKVSIQRDVASCSVSCRVLLRILSNLLLNACDAMPNGGLVEIDVKTGVYPYLTGGLKGKESICIAVKDSGSGIAKSKISHIFDPFYTSKEAITGHGLGLSVVRNLLREHGGWINVESEEGVGSVFRCYLPVAKKVAVPSEVPREENTAIETLVPPMENTISSNDSKTVLVVDDESIIRFSVERLLEIDGYNVLSADCGEAALEVLGDKEIDIDLLITDISMPGMNGDELASRALYLRDNLRLIVMSGFGANGIDEEWLEDKNGQFLAKPFSRTQLMDCVKVVFDGEPLVQ